MKSINTVVQDVYDVMKSKNYDGDLNAIAMQAGREVEEALKGCLYSKRRQPRFKDVGDRKM